MRRSRVFNETEVVPHATMTTFGKTWCQDCKRVKKFLGERRVAYEFVDVDEDADGLRLVEQANAGKRIIPPSFS
jgi:glutaredoxin